MSWYKMNIEPPLQDLVKQLRNEGVNTECSCGHNMYIQCQYILDGQIQIIHKTVWDYLAMNKGVFGYDEVDFDIVVKHKVRNGHSYTSLDISFPVKKNTEKLENGKQDL